MKFSNLQGHIYEVKLSDYLPSLNDTRPRSSYHLKCRELLQGIFPLDFIYEEVPILGEKLFIDFLIPVRKIAIETNGQQHFEFNAFFHKGSRANFTRSQKNDARKREWAQLNNFKLIELNYNESESEWRNKISG